jgi:hypothetical protein
MTPSSGTIEGAMPERLQWTLDRAALEPAARQARALEYIAHYLDRIEQHLERITKTLTTLDPAGEITLLSGVKNAADALKELAERD